MRRAGIIVLFSTLSTCVFAATESSRPRGVGPEFAKYYKATDSFACISDPSITLPITALNDDYCDCPDGSDEPGTAACTSLSGLSPAQPGRVGGTGANATLALPGFYCKNKGHHAAYLPHSFVDDGVCDYEVCCDGSDESGAAGGVKCADRCVEIGKEWRRLDEIRVKAMGNAMRKKGELVKEAKALRDGVVSSIAKLEGEVRGQEGKVEELKKKLEEVERRERGRVVKGTTGKASKVTVLAGLAKARVEELRERLLSVVGKRDALKEKVRSLEGILAAFKEEYNPNFNDEGVKRAVQAWENYAANKVDSDDSAEDRDIESISKPDSDTEGINWAEWETEEEESDVDVLYKFEEYLPQAVREWVHKKLADLRVLLVENGIVADNANSGSESKAVTDARSAYNSANDELSKKQTSVNTEKEDLSKDYGEDDIFRALKKICIEKDSGEYTYELCWLDKTTQKSKKGGGHTGMGNFVRFDTLDVDEEIGADGRGLGKGERLTLMYENGQHCWNGPNRQTTVVLGCAEKDEIWKVVEQEKCKYRMDVGTPAVCKRAETKAGTPAKDEL